MTALVDTGVWSLALRRRDATLSAAEARVVSQWRELVEAQRAALIGVVRQEILSGIKSARSFTTLAAHLNDMPYLPIGLAEHDLAAEFFNVCRSKGIACGAIDMLICAAASRASCPVLTVDNDFTRYARALPIVLLRG